MQCRSASRCPRVSLRPRCRPWARCMPSIPLTQDPPMQQCHSLRLAQSRLPHHLLLLLLLLPPHLLRLLPRPSYLPRTPPPAPAAAVSLSTTTSNTTSNISNTSSSSSRVARLMVMVPFSQEAKPHQQHFPSSQLPALVTRACRTRRRSPAAPPANTAGTSRRR
ncbi:hypothetical protein CAOG_08884 [Capsaspora owczarzaki ATCC 30864]|uniref:hypothetical protein n=1 Tax=Capsaspora owczarzaki (strain ATCC 30864) TaxID=595528 RepID=UPI00035211E9|nr:hypothetical protein CAOG_08884 [Capsaspora owczarzaki ATCC 30864]|eukprot:XP_011270546.1 hypothetical protein CAOG_08884 [Capsaspora owczarzaki ATCC 30864]